MKSRILELIRQWRERLRGLPVGLEGRILAAGLVALVALVWLVEHDAQVRRAGELAEIRKQAAADVASLKARVDAARREVDQQNARAVRELEARQARLAQAGNELRERAAALQQEERAQVERAATLPTSEVATQVAARLGLSAQELARPGGQVPASAASGSPASASQAAPTQAGARAGSAGPGFRLDEPALRKVNAALIQLDACHEQSVVLNQQVENCHSQVATQAELARQEGASIEKLHQALADQDQMIVQLKKQHAAELEAARGSRWHRFVATLEHVALGVALGVVLR